MATNGADHVVDQVARQATYETLREVANQLIGVLVDRERSAHGDAPADLSDERRAIRARLHAIEPGTPAVDAALDEWAARLRELRAGGDA